VTERQDCRYGEHADGCNITHMDSHTFEHTVGGGVKLRGYLVVSQ
jgi:hypothetical protein